MNWLEMCHNSKKALFNEMVYNHGMTSEIDRDDAELLLKKICEEGKKASDTKAYNQRT